MNLIGLDTMINITSDQYRASGLQVSSDRSSQIYTTYFDQSDHSICNNYDLIIVITICNEVVVDSKECWAKALNLVINLAEVSKISDP